MDTDLRRPFVTSIGMAVGIGLVALVTGEVPDRGFLLGIALVPAVFVALENIDGPLERRTARIGAIVTAGGLLGAAFWLL